MGNSLGGKKTTKIMKINGESFKLKTPVEAGMVVKDYPGHVLLESEAVKHFGIRAKPLELHQQLQPKRLYFLVELPNFPQENNGARRVRSGINMTAKDRLESLMLSRRSASDLTIMKPASIMVEESKQGSDRETTLRVKMRLPKAEVAKLMMESKDEAEAAQKIVNLFMADNNIANTTVGVTAPPVADQSSLLQQQVHWKAGHGHGLGHGSGSARDGFKLREKRVTFLPINNGEMQVAVAS